MKKIFYIFPALFVLSSCLSSRLYEPGNDTENMFYININKDIFPDDIRININEHLNDLVGWVGIVEDYNIENNIIRYTIKHHYYDWIEDFGYFTGPILLSSDGEGYIVGDFILRSDIIEEKMNEYFNDFIGDCLIVYGYPVEILNDNTISLNTKYVRRISKKYVDPNWKKYGRKGLQ